MNESPLDVVCDAGPLIHLDELGGGRDAQAALTALIAQAKRLLTAV